MKTSQATTYTDRIVIIPPRVEGSQHAGKGVHQFLPK
jgi:hypothetical protein